MSNIHYATRAEKQGSRSMVEMLGVLAIIGVLSIGGIAGYTMAMNRYRANEILDAASKMAVIAMTKQSAPYAVSQADIGLTNGVGIAGTDCTLSVSDSRAEALSGVVTVAGGDCTTEGSAIQTALFSIAGETKFNKTGKFFRFDGNSAKDAKPTDPPAGN